MIQYLWKKIGWNLSKLGALLGLKENMAHLMLWWITSLFMVFCMSYEREMGKVREGG